MTPVGTGIEEGWVAYDIRTGGGEEESPGGDQPEVAGSDEADRLANDATRRTDVTGKTAQNRPGTLPPERGLNPNAARANITEKGSFLVFPHVEVKWNAAGELIQDTFVDLSNDFTRPVHVQTYLVDGDQCVWADAAFTLTKEQPTYWSVLTGEPQGANMFPSISPGCPEDQDLECNRGGRYIRGYLLVWAVDPATLSEIRWNHLKGDALVVNYAEGSAWEYNAWAFQAVSGTVSGDLLLAPYGLLELDGNEYVAAPDQLLLDFYGSGTVLSGGAGRQASLDTILTLWAVQKDLRLNVAPPRLP
jgi:hypothetical protein